jgi:Xaa-Pro aminopeptidase
MGDYINSPVSTSELERRWAAIRAAMDGSGIEALLIAGANDLMHGYIKYLTDMPAFGYPSTLIFPRQDSMSLVVHGNLDGSLTPDPTDTRYRGVNRVLTCSSFATAHYSLGYEAAQVVHALKPFLRGRIGLVGAQAMSSSILDEVRKALGLGGAIVDASDLVDRVKAIRSSEEIQAARATAAIQDASIAAVLEKIQPGMREREIIAEAALVNRRLGSEQGVYLCSSGPMDMAAPLRPPHMQERRLEAGDAFHFLVETSGPGGLYTEIGRTIVLGSPSAQMGDEFEFVIAARRFTLDRMNPGANVAAIWADYNEFMRANGRPEENRLYCHGQGYDLVERPLVRFDEGMPLARDMIFACHPTYVHQSRFNWICDSFLVTDARPERLHKTPEALLIRS